MAHSKIAILAVLSILTLGLSACEPGGVSQGTIFAGGTNALLLSYERGAPPDLIYDNSQTPFAIFLKARNDGEFDTNDVRWRITGINQNDFKNLNPSDVYDGVIMGRTKLQDQEIEGREEYIQLGDNICYERSLSGGGELRDLSITAHVCYAYATLATATVCIREDYLDGGDGCDPRESSQISVSGAPVTITGFSQQAVGPKKLRLQFDVALRNNQRVWAPYEGQTCSQDKTRSTRITERDRIYGRINSNNIGEISCTTLRPGDGFDGPYVLSDAYPQDLLSGNAIRVVRINSDDDGYFQLGSDGSASIICTLEVDDDLTDSLGTVDLALAYFLEDTVTTPLTITHAGGPAGQC
jgi:hypothetical protein